LIQSTFNPNRPNKLSPAECTQQQQEKATKGHRRPPRPYDDRRHCLFRFLLLFSVAGLGLLVFLLGLGRLGQHHQQQQDEAGLDALALNSTAIAAPALPFYRLDAADPFNQTRRFVWKAGSVEEDVISDKEPPARRASVQLRVEGDPTFRPAASFDPIRAHHCLRNKSIVFVGDSITRYTYLNFVNWIENGAWTNPQDPQLEDERH
jgi:hypothetical protein